MYSKGQSTPEEDGWNWPWILFIGMRELLWDEEKIWKTTPRKFFALLECAKSYSEGEKKESSGNNGKGTQPKVKDGYVDQINW